VGQIPAILGGLALLVGMLVLFGRSGSTSVPTTGPVSDEPRHLGALDGVLAGGGTNPSSLSDGSDPGKTGARSSRTEPGNTSTGDDRSGVGRGSGDSSTGLGGLMGGLGLTTGGSGPKTPRQTVSDSAVRSVSVVGRQLSGLLGDRNVLAMALYEPEGSFVYRRGSGWLRLTGNSWEPIGYESVPSRLKQRYPPTVYGPNGAVSMSPSGSGGGGGKNRSGTHGTRIGPGGSSMGGRQGGPGGSGGGLLPPGVGLADSNGGNLAEDADIGVTYIISPDLRAGPAVNP